jgi:uncharacterized Fe-S center protein
MASKVFFTNMRTKPGVNMYDKLNRLIKKAGIEDLEMENKLVALKLHFGEPGNLAYLRQAFPD